MSIPQSNSRLVPYGAMVLCLLAALGIIAEALKNGDPSRYAEAALCAAASAAFLLIARWKPGN